MARPKKRTANACQYYRHCNNDLDDICQSKNWKPHHVHHIYGRGTLEEYDWFCNLVLLPESLHIKLHDEHPAIGEVECLFAKWNKRHISTTSSPQYMDWNPEALSKICGCVSLAGRLEGIILPKLREATAIQSVFKKCIAMIVYLNEFH